MLKDVTDEWDDFMKELNEAVKAGKRVWAAKPEPTSTIIKDDIMPEHDATHPNNYHKGGLECFDVIKAITGDKYEGFLVGNIIKYIFRYHDKNGVEDCKKAAVYLDKLIKELTDNAEE